jgi:hypothetical protein
MTELLSAAALRCTHHVLAIETECACTGFPAGKFNLWKCAMQAISEDSPAAQVTSCTLVNEQDSHHGVQHGNDE